MTPLKKLLDNQASLLEQNNQLLTELIAVMTQAPSLPLEAANDAHYHKSDSHKLSRQAVMTLREKMITLAENKAGNLAVRRVLQQHGAKRLDQVTPKNYQPILDAVNQLLEECHD